MRWAILLYQPRPFCVSFRLGATIQRIRYENMVLDRVTWAFHRHTSGLTDRTFASAADILGKWWCGRGTGSL